MDRATMSGRPTEVLPPRARSAYVHIERDVTLRDGKVGRLRLLCERDADALHKMFSTLSAAARQFLYDDVTNSSIVRKWTTEIDYSSILPLVVEVERKIVADATLHRRRSGPMRHVGRIRAVVHDDWHGKGIGTILAQALIEEARSERLKLVTTTLAEFDEGDAVEAMKALGFRRVAILPDFMIDPEGKLHAMTVLSMKLE